MRISLTAALAALILSAGLQPVAVRADMAMSMGAHAHMEMTELGSPKPGDRARADAIVSKAREAMALFPTVADAERAGFKKFLPNVPLPIEHYTSDAYAVEAWHGRFDASHPTSLIYKRTGDTLKLTGVMYTAGAKASLSKLDSAVPLSVTQWHRHVNLCQPPVGVHDLSRFGFGGSIETKAECDAAGGKFVPLIFGWMVHVWPLETDSAKVWAVDASHDDGSHAAMHGMTSPHH